MGQDAKASRQLDQIDRLALVERRVGISEERRDEGGVGVGQKRVVGRIVGRLAPGLWSTLTVERLYLRPDPALRQRLALLDNPNLVHQP